MKNIDVDIDIDIKEFEAQQKALLKLFLQFWNKCHDYDPVKFPKKMTTSLWDQQFQAFKECNRGCTKCDPKKCYLIF